MKPPYLNRELSWVEFNQRVLDQARRNDLPLLERVRFLAITASNLDEFFQVRIGGLHLLLKSGFKQPDPSGLTPSRNLSCLRDRILVMLQEQYRLLNEELVPALRDAGIYLLSHVQLDAAQSVQSATIFQEQIFPLLTPLAVDESGDPPDVPALQPVVACRLEDPASGATRYALIPIPDTVPRRIALTAASGHAFVLAEDLVAVHAASFFPDEQVCDTTVFRVTRNSDIAVQENDTTDLADEMEEVLNARRFAETIRLELKSDAPRDLAAMIQRVTATGPKELYRVDGPPGLAAFADLASLPDHDHLRFDDWTPQDSPSITPGDGMFDTIASGDLMLFHPYESFDPVLRLLDEAADDPNVVAIKQVLYRTARKSRVIDALIRAAQNGKNVTALVELKARFDEARNLDRADELRRAGAQIVYGVKGLKTHAKILMIVRRESGHLRRYLHLGTGNYNESTARLYTDVSYFTCKPEFGHDASLFFNAVSGRSKLLRFHRLIPAPTAMKPKLLELITGEADRAKNGLPARITAKMNSLQDPDLIAALYEASRAGVEIRLNVRGICCLKPGDPRYSKTIEVISIIDRCLEHARIFHFHHGGDSQVYIASADWMTRNLEKRVELMIPIEDATLQRRLIRLLDSFFQDNQQASRLLPDGTSQRVLRAKGQRSFRAQEQCYLAACKAAKAREHERAMTFEPHVPPSLD
jgi:polyphosphate kinase